jgi:transketolase C-terminal domain/subunit
MSEHILASTREAAGQAILELAREGVDVVAVSADTSKSMYTTLLKKRLP